MERIDFNTSYNPEGFASLYKTARERGISSLVMSDLERGVNYSPEGVRIFPAQKVSWNAALEVQGYDTQEDFARQKSSGYSNRAFGGEALILLPEDLPLPRVYDSDLYSIFEGVHQNGGIVISLQDDNDYFIVASTTDSKKDYPFDSVRVRPQKVKDINSLLPYCNFPVFGSAASSGSDLNKNYGFTMIEGEVRSQQHLIDLIKANHPTKIMVDNGEGLVPIEETVPKPNIILRREK